MLNTEDMILIVILLPYMTKQWSIMLPKKVIATYQTKWVLGIISFKSIERVWVWLVDGFHSIVHQWCLYVVKTGHSTTCWIQFTDRQLYIYYHWAQMNQCGVGTYKKWKLFEYSIQLSHLKYFFYTVLSIDNGNIDFTMLQ